MDVELHEGPPAMHTGFLLSWITDEKNPVKSFYSLWSSLIKLTAFTKKTNADHEIVQSCKETDKQIGGIRFILFHGLPTSHMLQKCW